MASTMQNMLDAKADQWETEAILAIAGAIKHGQVARVEYFETTTGKGTAVKITSTEEFNGGPYKFACLVDNYEAARRSPRWNIPELPQTDAAPDLDQLIEDHIDAMCETNHYM